MPRINVLVYRTSEGIEHIHLYKDFRKPRDVIKLRKQKIEDNDEYEILESTTSKLVFMDKVENVKVEYYIKSCNLEDKEETENV